MSTPDVVTECELPDTPEKVWKALTAPKCLAAWLPEAIQSEILEAEPNKRLRYRWEAGEQDKDAGGRAVESDVTFELTGTPAGGTRLRVVHRVLEQAPLVPFVRRQKTTMAMANGFRRGRRRRRGSIAGVAVLWRWAA